MSSNLAETFTEEARDAFLAFLAAEKARKEEHLRAAVAIAKKEEEDAFLLLQAREKLRKDEEIRRATAAAEIEERAAYLRFRATEQARKDEEALAEERRKAEEEEMKKNERINALNLFRDIMEKMLAVHYGQTDSEIISLGKRIKESGAGSVMYNPNNWLTMWRDARYTGRIERRNYSMSWDVNLEQIKREGFSIDGWPIEDEADSEAKKLARVEWEKWLSFCLHFAERADSENPLIVALTKKLSEAEARIAELEASELKLRKALAIFSA